MKTDIAKVMAKDTEVAISTDTETETEEELAMDMEVEISVVEETVKDGGYQNHTVN